MLSRALIPSYIPQAPPVAPRRTREGRAMDRLLYHIVPLLLLVFFSGLIGLWAVLVRRSDARLETAAKGAGWLGALLYLAWIVALTRQSIAGTPASFM